MIDFYMFVTTRGDISAEGLLDEHEAIEEARRLGDSGKTVLAILRGGRPWLKEGTLETMMGHVGIT
jgi:hypothetical protein